MKLKAPGKWYHGLTPKERRFLEEYIVDLNGTAAAKRAGYAEKNAKKQAWQILRKDHVRAALAQYLDELSVPSEEALYRLSRIARGDIANLITINEDGTWKLDLQKALDEGHTSLIQELSYDAHGNPKLKLYSAHEAQRDLAKIRGLFVDRIANPDGSPLTIQIVRE